MRRAFSLVCIIAIWGCRSRSSEPPAEPAHAHPPVDESAANEPVGASEAVVAAPAPSASGLTCTRQPFATEIGLPEASGAVYVPADGGRPAHLLVVADSGNQGQVVELDLETGEALRTGRLPLESPRQASDDIEGLAHTAGVFYGLTSAGWVREWTLREDGKGYQLTRGPYAIAARKGPSSSAVCDPHGVNCGRNYEGLCLRDVPAGPRALEDLGVDCAGFAASKQTGRLYCVVVSDGERSRLPRGALTLDLDRVIQVDKAHAVTGCHFTPHLPDTIDDSATGKTPGAPAEPTLWVGANLFSRNRVYQVRGWREPAAAEVVVVASLGSGFPEAIALAPGGLVYRFSDTAAHPSLADKYRCE